MSRKPLGPSIYCDEHIPPEVSRIFRDLGFRTISIGVHAALRGRDERSYIAALYRDNGIFVTSDAEAIQRWLDENVKHAGLIYVPSRMGLSEKILFAEIAGGFIQGATANGRFVMRNQLVYPAHDGLRVIEGDDDELMASWDRLFNS